MLRMIDILLAGLGFVAALPLMVALFLVGLFDTGAPLFSQVRVGRLQKPFTIVKFRTMKIGTQSVATHLVGPTSTTTIGAFMRRTKLDELPQLWNVVKGDMSLVGPRPCLFNQKKLIFERARRDVFGARPGLTGLAQIKGIDMSTPRLLAETDAYMLKTMSLKAYIGYIIKTATLYGRVDRIK